jgi:hypothetical protein
MTVHPTNTSEASPALDVADRYVAFWNAADADERQRLAAATFSDNVTNHAPIGVMHGVAELIGFRNQFAQHSPGYVFRSRTQPQAHHGHVRLQWEIVVGGESFATGTDVLHLDDQGHITAIIGFLDRAPEGFAHADH